MQKSILFSALLQILIVVIGYAKTEMQMKTAE